MYSTEPPAGGFRWADVQPAVDAPLPQPRETVDDAVGGAATVESWVVAHGRDGVPERVLAACLLDDGRRAWASSDDVATVAELRSGDETGRAVKVDPAGALLL